MDATIGRCSWSQSFKYFRLVGADFIKSSWSMCIEVKRKWFFEEAVTTNTRIIRRNWDQRSIPIPFAGFSFGLFIWKILRSFTKRTIQFLCLVNLKEGRNKYYGLHSSQFIRQQPKTHHNRIAPIAKISSQLDLLTAKSITQIRSSVHSKHLLAL